MNTYEAAQHMIARAALILDEACYLQGKGAWNLVVRRAQEVVELALKAALLWAGLEAPHTHDVGPVLKLHAERFTEPFQRQIPRLASISRALRAEREISFYGDEQSGVPSETLYTLEDAGESLSKAREALEACRVLIASPGGTA